MRYFTGDGVDRDYEKAHALCYKAMEDCSGDAAFILAKQYGRGLGVNKDEVQALGWSYLVKGDTYGRPALEMQHELLAELTPYQVAGARAFAYSWEKRHCKVVNQPEPDSYEWVMDNGDASMQERLGVRFFQGIGVARDYDKAYALCYKAAEHCLADAATVLAYQTMHGYGAPKNLVAALGWNYVVASDASYETVMKMRKELEAQLTPEEITKARAFADEWENLHCRLAK